MTNTTQWTASWKISKHAKNLPQKRTNSVNRETSQSFEGKYEQWVGESIKGIGFYVGCHNFGNMNRNRAGRPSYNLTLFDSWSSSPTFWGTLDASKPRPSLNEVRFWSCWNDELLSRLKLKVNFWTWSCTVWFAPDPSGHLVWLSHGKGHWWSLQLPVPPHPTSLPFLISFLHSHCLWSFWKNWKVIESLQEWYVQSHFLPPPPPAPPSSLLPSLPPPLLHIQPSLSIALASRNQGAVLSYPTSSSYQGIKVLPSPSTIPSPPRLLWPPSNDDRSSCRPCSRISRLLFSRSYFYTAYLRWFGHRHFKIWRRKNKSTSGLFWTLLDHDQ